MRDAPSWAPKQALNKPLAYLLKATCSANQLLTYPMQKCMPTDPLTVIA